MALMLNMDTVMNFLILTELQMYTLLAMYHYHHYQMVDKVHFNGDS